MVVLLEGSVVRAYNYEEVLGEGLLDHMCDADQVINSSIINTEIQGILFISWKPVCFMGRPNIAIKG